MSRQPLLIVDGSNLLHADAEYRRVAARDVDSARARLASELAAFAADEYRAVVVFDGGEAGAPRHLLGAVIIFSGRETDADAIIERLALRARGRGDRALVVTSDAATRWTVLGQGVDLVTSSEFSRRLDVFRSEIAAETPSGSPRSTVEERLPPEVRERLRRWARGERS